MEPSTEHTDGVTDDEGKSPVGLDRVLYVLESVTAVATSLLFLYTTFFGSFQAVVQRSALLGLVLLLVYLRLARFSRSKVATAVLAVLGLVAGTTCLYMVVMWNDVAARFARPVDVELWLSGALIVLLMYAGKRLLGWGFPILVSLFLLYALLGPMLPDSIAHSGVDFDRLLATLYLTTRGMWGLVLGVAATIIIQFIIFATFLRVSGAGDFFMDLAKGMFGSMRGGPAKIAVVGSGLTGMFNGVATANVATTGAITIPLMKRTGYTGSFAGAVEAAASTGGQILPPIMGAAAFVMAESLGLPIAAIITAAAIPAIFFFLVIFVAVDLRGARLGLQGLPRSELPSARRALRRGWLYFVPVLVLVAVLYMQFSPARAAGVAIAALVLLSPLFPGRPLTLRTTVQALKEAAHDAALVTVACALAGIVIAVLNATGIGVALGGYIIALAGGSLIALLLLTMVTSLVLGMGLPTIAGYIVVSLTVAPALVNSFDVLPLVAHLFVFYFAILSVLTPPVAVASYVAAGMAQADPVRTSLQAFVLAIPVFMIPFLFVSNNGLLLMGSPVQIASAILLTAIALFALVTALEGYQVRPLAIWTRIILGVAALAMISPATFVNVPAATVVLALVGYNYLKGRGAGPKEAVRGLKEPAA
jgi:TRAP transporter 4TM/12TM fusion protein